MIIGSGFVGCLLGLEPLVLKWLMSKDNNEVDGEEEDEEDNGLNEAIFEMEDEDKEDVEDGVVMVGFKGVIKLDFNEEEVEVKDEDEDEDNPFPASRIGEAVVVWLDLAWELIEEGVPRVAIAEE